MQSAWWKAYGLLYDPLANAPVPKGEPETLVRTPAVAELAAYLDSSSPHGHIFLVTGGYGSGKTTVLYALESLIPPGRNCEVHYEDISKFRSREKLQDLFKGVIDKANRTIKNGKRPVFSFDQLHNLKTDVVDAFFKENQTAFEQLKPHGVTIVFAGDERFGNLVRTGGPLGAIFDREFRVPAFEEELASEMIALRIRKASEDYVGNPFTPEAIRFIVRKSNGNPRYIIDMCGTVMKYSASKKVPIRITEGDVVAATAELTDESLVTIRNELRSPNLSNALAKLGRLHGENRGHEKIHDVGRLLDFALDDSTLSLEEQLKKLDELNLRPDVVVDAVAGIGLTESFIVKSKGSYGSVTSEHHRLSKHAFAGLARIRERTGLQPSQYLHKVASDATVVGVKSGSDLLYHDVSELKDSLRSSRAKVFMSRALPGIRLCDSPDIEPRSLVGIYRDYLRALSLEIFNNVPEDLIEASLDISKLVSFDDQSKADFISGVEKLEELSTLYESRGVDWDSEQAKNAVSAVRSIMQISVIPVLTLVRSGRDPVAEKSVQESLSAYYKSSRHLMEKVGTLNDLPKNEKLASVAARIGVESRRINDSFPQTLQIMCESLDNLAYSKAIEHEQQWYSEPIKKALQGLVVAKGDQWSSALTLACRILNEVTEQAPVIINSQAKERKFGQVIRNLVSGTWGTETLQKAKENKFSHENRQALEEYLSGCLSKMRSCRQLEDFRDACLCLMYTLRNQEAHSIRSLRIHENNIEIAQAFMVTLRECLKYIMSECPWDGVELAVVDKSSSDGYGLVSISNQVVVVVDAPRLEDGEIVEVKVSKTETFDGFFIRSFKQRIDWSHFKKASPKQLESLPEVLRNGVLGLRKEEVRNPHVRGQIKVMKLFLNKKGNACVEYGTPPVACLVREPKEEDCPQEIVDAAIAGLSIVGLPYTRGSAGNVNVFPITPPAKSGVLEVWMKALRTPAPRKANPLATRDEVSRPWKFQ